MCYPCLNLLDHLNYFRPSSDWNPLEISFIRSRDSIFGHESGHEDATMGRGDDNETTTIYRTECLPIRICWSPSIRRRIKSVEENNRQLYSERWRQLLQDSFTSPRGISLLPAPRFPSYLPRAYAAGAQVNSLPCALPFLVSQT